MGGFWGLPGSTQVPLEELGTGPPMGLEERGVADAMLANGYWYQDHKEGWRSENGERLGRPGDHLAVRYDTESKGFVNREGKPVEDDYLAEQAEQGSWGFGRTWLSFGEPDPGLPGLREGTGFERAVEGKRFFPVDDEGKALEARGFKGTGRRNDPHWRTPNGQRMDPEQFQHWRFHGDGTIEQPFFDGDVGNEALEQVIRKREHEREAEQTNALKGDSVVSGISAHVRSALTDRGTAAVDHTEQLATGFEELARGQSPVPGGPTREHDGIV